MEKTVLVTGASSGIGKELVLVLLQQGHRVYAGVRDVKKGKAVLGSHPRLSILPLDVNRPEHVIKAARHLNQGLDVLINNAGFGLYGAFEELTEDSFRHQFETNFFAPLRLTRTFLPAMRQKGGGQIINISSILGRIVIPTGSAYCSSKWAMEGWSEALRYEVFPFGIHVTCVEPGLIQTSFKQSMQTSESVSKKESPYHFLNREIEHEYQRPATDPVIAAKRIARLIRMSNPPPRFRVGMDAHFYHILRTLLPDSILDFLVKSYLKSRMI
jgi:short-subunit dehydrogenase